jgi:hypothetical protein
MAYPGQFHRLVMIGSLYGDIWNCTLNIVPSALGELGMPAVDDATLTSVAGDVSTWFPKTTAQTGCGFISSVKLTSIKLNRISATGHYVDNPKEHVYTTPIPGTDSIRYAPQLASVITLGTALARGRGSKGRIFLPPTTSLVVSTDGRMGAGAPTVLANGVKTLITALNARYTLVGRVGVASGVGLGRFEHVTKLLAGRTIDTMRSRRSALLEDYESVTV